MGGATKNLDGKRGLNSARAFFQKPDVLIFGLANSAKRGPKTDADAMLRFFPGIIEGASSSASFAEATANCA